MPGEPLDDPRIVSSVPGSTARSHRAKLLIELASPLHAQFKSTRGVDCRHRVFANLHGSKGLPTPGTRSSANAIRLQVGRRRCQSFGGPRCRHPEDVDGPPGRQLQAAAARRSGHRSRRASPRGAEIPPRCGWATGPAQRGRKTSISDRRIASTAVTPLANSTRATDLPQLVGVTNLKPRPPAPSTPRRTARPAAGSADSTRPAPNRNVLDTQLDETLGCARTATNEPDRASRCALAAPRCAAVDAPRLASAVALRGCVTVVVSPRARADARHVSPSDRNSCRGLLRRAGPDYPGSPRNRPGWEDTAASERYRPTHRPVQKARLTAYSFRAPSRFTSCRRSSRRSADAIHAVRAASQPSAITSCIGRNVSSNGDPRRALASVPVSQSRDSIAT